MKRLPMPRPKTENRQPTMGEVAKRAGVSQPTVSRILNGKADVARISDETQQRVWKTIEEMGYRSNQAARAVRTGRFGYIMLLLSADNLSRSHLPDELLWGIDMELESHDQHLTVSHFRDEAFADDEYVPRVLRRYMADGVLFNYNYQFPANMRKIVESLTVPVVWINADEKQDCVLPDDYGAARRLTEKLILEGHRKITYLDALHPLEGHVSEHYSVRERVAGYLAAMKKHNLEPDIRTAPADGTSAYPWTRAWIKKARPNAVVAYSYEALQPALIAALENGWQVPHHLAVATFDAVQTFHCEYKIPTMIEPLKYIGQAAARMLLSKIDGQTEPHTSVRVPFGLSGDWSDTEKLLKKALKDVP